MKFSADIIFEDVDCLFCPELDEGFQIFKSWSEFIELYIEHMHSSIKPMYVFKATLSGSRDVFVNAGQLVVIPWDEIENYI